VANKPYDESRRQQPGLLSLRRLVDLDGEAAAFGPALVHTQQHLGPVLRVRAARARVHFAHRVELVVLAREQRLQLQRAEASPELVDRLDQFGGERGVVRLVGQFQQGAGVFQRRAESVELVEVVGDPAQFPGDRAGVVLVVPEVGLGHLGLELGPAGLELLPAQVALGLGEPIPQGGELGGEVAGFLCAGPRGVRRRHGRT
jgi:hypothetical protein